jgi:hypothetical protein
VSSKLYSRAYLRPIALLLATLACSQEPEHPWERTWAPSHPPLPRCFSIASDTTAVASADGWLAPPTHLLLDTSRPDPRTLGQKPNFALRASAESDSSYPGGWWAGIEGTDSIGAWFFDSMGLETVGMIGRIETDSSFNGYYTGERDQAHPPSGRFTGRAVRCNDT